MVFHHIGIACKDIEKALYVYKQMGYETSSIIIDKLQNVKICFVSKQEHPLLELIEPLNDLAPVNRILFQIGNTPYHNAYTTKNINKKIIELKEMGFLLLGKPINATAINGKKICFMYNRDIGLIELIGD